jgi:hypothetical protein
MEYAVETFSLTKLFPDWWGRVTSNHGIRS